jgi:hypothetical protein
MMHSTASFAEEETSSAGKSTLRSVRSTAAEYRRCKEESTPFGFRAYKYNSL